MLITFEGIDGSGKTTHSGKLYRLLKERGKSVVLYREPGGTEVGEKIRKILLDSQLTPEAELLLFEASRNLLVSEKVKKDLEEGKIVILDRFTDSTLAYQGFGRKLDISFIRLLNKFATMGIEPDVTILLDLDPLISLQRVEINTRFDNYEFLKSVRDGFLKIARDEPDRFIVVDSSEGDEQEVFGRIVSLLKKLTGLKLFD